MTLRFQNGKLAEWRPTWLVLGRRYRILLDGQVAVGRASVVGRQVVDVHHVFSGIDEFIPKECSQATVASIGSAVLTFWEVSVSQVSPFGWELASWLTASASLPFDADKS
jgi:hypothetical protein